MCAVFAGRIRRARSLVMYGSYAEWIGEPGYPWAMTREEHERAFAAFEKHWGTPVGLQRIAPAVASDERYRSWSARSWPLAAPRRGEAPQTLLHHPR